jgi:hypothetical protein
MAGAGWWSFGNAGDDRLDVPAERIRQVEGDQGGGLDGVGERVAVVQVAGDPGDQVVGVAGGALGAGLLAGGPSARVSVAVVISGSSLSLTC